MQKLKQAGFTLLEMMLVMAIISAIVTMAVNISEQRVAQFQRDRAAVQIQQILNAALSYYTSNGIWPVVATCNGTSTETLNASQMLQTSSFLPPTAGIVSPWQTNYSVGCNTTNGLNFFYVTVDATSAANADVLAGELPIATVNGTIVTTNITVPGQNLNNARSVNFANVYHPGGCVPVPTCPNGMTAEVFVVPSSVTGMSDSDTTFTGVATAGGGSPPSAGGTPLGYPITSFTAYVSGPPATTPLSCDVWSDPMQANAVTPTATACVQTGTTNVTTPPNYWRVCLDIQTTKGKVSVTGNTLWAQNMYVVALTRCSPLNENTGSDFTVWSN